MAAKSGRSGLRSAVADVLWYPRLQVEGVDLLHCPSFRGPFAPSVPLVVTVHDLAVLREPAWFNRWTRTYSRIAVPRVVRAASRLIAVSEFTKRELAGVLGVEEAKISVVPNAVEDVFTPDQKREIIERLTETMVSIEGENMRSVAWSSPRRSRAATGASAAVL